MKAALYARVSTDDKGQDPDVQLLQLREHAHRQGWEVEEFVDRASARDLRGRREWRRLLQGVERHSIGVVAVTKLDRAFRSSKDTYDHLALMEHHGCQFTAITQLTMDGSLTGRLVLGILAAVAEFEGGLIRERVKEGLNKARADGKRLGRPPGSTDKRPRHRRRNS